MLARTLCLMLLLATGARAESCAEVEVLDVRARQGHLMLAAYASADSFRKQPLVTLRLPAADATMRVQLCGLSGTTVALLLYQDLDSDGKLASNWIGIPSEPWGSSGTPGAFGPSWETAKVALDGRPIVVRMSK